MLLAIGLKGMNSIYYMKRIERHATQGLALGERFHKSKIPGPDRICESGVNNDRPNKHAGMVKDYQSSRARAGRNPKSKIE